MSTSSLGRKPQERCVPVTCLVVVASPRGGGGCRCRLIGWLVDGWVIPHPHPAAPQQNIADKEAVTSLRRCFNLHAAVLHVISTLDIYRVVTTVSFGW